MIICPACSVQLQKQENQLLCPDCGFGPTEVDDILCFAPGEADEDFDDYKVDGLELLYKYEQAHFWFKNRKRWIRRMFHKYVKKNQQVMEIGAGTGNVARMLTREGCQPALGDIHLKGLKYAKQYGLNRLYQFDARKAPFKEEYDAVCLFDVLEHIEDDQVVMENIRQMLKKEGKLILTVPAHRFLWSTIDVVSGHKRRYGLKELKSIIINNGFEVLETRHFFTLLFPFFFLRKWLNIKKKTKSFNDVNAGLKINGFLNAFFNVLSIMDYYLFARFSPGFGGSIILVAKKVQDTTEIYK